MRCVVVIEHRAEEKKTNNEKKNSSLSFLRHYQPTTTPAPPPPLLRRAAAASAAAVLSVSALLGSPTLDASAVETASSSSSSIISTSSSSSSPSTPPPPPSPPPPPPSYYHLPVVSPDPDVLSVQRVLLQAWDIVDRAFVDGSFGGRDRGEWRGDLVDSLDAAAGAGAAGGGGGGGARLAELAIDAMLDRLGDPYTRRMPSRDYEAFRQSSEGEIAGGVGLLIAAQPVREEEEEGGGVGLSSSAGSSSSSSSSSSPLSLSSSPSSSSPTSNNSSSSLSNSTRLRSRLVVLSPIEGGPAARAGIRPGDEVLAIDGRPTDGFDGESAAGLLRGPRGSSVVVDVARREVEDGAEGGMVPGIPGRAPPQRLSGSSATEMMMTTPNGTNSKKKNSAAPPRVSIRQVRLRREKVELSPVTSSVLTVDGGGGEGLAKQKKKTASSSSQHQQQQQHRVGYLRLASFNARAAADTARALAQMRSQGAEAFVLDLRGNGGGLVRAAVDVSRSLLPRGSTVFAVQGRSEEEERDEMDKNHYHLMRAMTPPASPGDVVPASSGVPATAITQRVVLDDNNGDGDEVGEGGLNNNKNRSGGARLLKRVMTMLLPNLSSSSSSQQQQDGESDVASLHSPLSTPLAVLVDRNSASASEILAGALRDNGRAALVGERTFGKGKIQSVFPLRDGSALFVTVARYMTPSEELIDGVGIKPETACRGGGGGGGRGGGRNNNSNTLLASLEMVPGVVREAGALQASLAADSCVLTAERLLLAQVEKLQQQEQEGGGGMGGGEGGATPTTANKGRRL